MPSSHDLEQDKRMAACEAWVTGLLGLDCLVRGLVADIEPLGRQVEEIGERLAAIEARLEKKNKKEKKDE